MRRIVTHRCRSGVSAEGQDLVLHRRGRRLESSPASPTRRRGVRAYLCGARVMSVDELFAAAKRMKQQYGEQVEFHMVGSFEGLQACHGRAGAGGCGQVPRLSVGYEVVLRHGELRGAAVLSRGMSNVLLEAAASGRPLFASDIPAAARRVEMASAGICALRRTQMRCMRLCSGLQHCLWNSALKWDAADVSGWSSSSAKPPLWRNHQTLGDLKCELVVLMLIAVALAWCADHVTVRPVNPNRRHRMIVCTLVIIILLAGVRWTENALQRYRRISSWL